MDGLKERIREVVFNVEKSLYTRLELWKFKTVIRGADVVSSLVLLAIIFFIAAVSFIILSIGAAYWIGYYLNKISNGFFIVGGFYIFLCLVIYVFREHMIRKPIKDHILNKFIDK